MLSTSLKTGDYIPYGRLIPKLLGATSRGERFYSANVWKFLEEKMFFLGDNYLRSYHILFLIS